MTIEDPRRGKWITPDANKKGAFKAGGKEYKNPVKSEHISPVILDDLKSLAIEAFAGEFEDSMGQSHLDDALMLLRKKYPGEQPHEVWRRDIATLVGEGIEAKIIAERLVGRNSDLMTSIKLRSLTPEGRDKAIQTLVDKIKEYWPSAPQRG